MKVGVGWFGAIWGVGGVLAILCVAMARLMPVAVEALDGTAGPVGVLHWLAALLSLAFFGYTEGYRAFQMQFSPRVVARGASLLRSPRPVRVVLAPLFCMGFFGATRKRLIVSWSLAVGIFGLIQLVRALPQPWRGIIDLGVAIALAWGAAAILAFSVRAALGETLPIDPDVPAEPDATKPSSAKVLSINP